MKQWGEVLVAPQDALECVGKPCRTAVDRANLCSVSQGK